MSARTSGGPLVALIDDSEANRYAVARILVTGGFDVREAATEAEALQLLPLPPDVIILGIPLSDTDGFDLCRRLKNDPATWDIPVLLISASATGSEWQEHGLSGGADGYLVHPVEPPELLATVRTLLRARDAEARLAQLLEEERRARAAEEVVRQRQKLESIGLLAGGIAHDFNNLLTGILGNASLAQRTLSPDSPAVPMLADVVRASERAAALTNQLLAYAGKGRFFVQPVDLARLIQDISGLIRSSLPKKVEDRREIDAELPLVEADAAQLQQVVMNLVINGAEAIGDAPGVVTISAREEEVSAAELRERFAAFNLSPGKYVRLEVRDTGCGMDAAIQGRIFEPFFTTKFTGRGLGLAAVLGIIRRHKGGIAVESAPGQGTMFTVLLPAPAGTPPPPAEPAVRRPARQGTGTVLVVDDEDLVRRTARSTLEQYGYGVLEAVNGVEAIDLVRHHGNQIALVLLDMTMPVMSGDEAVRHLKRLRPALPVLATSGYGELEAIRRFTGTGVSGFLQKPYTAEELMERVEAVLASLPFSGGS